MKLADKSKSYLILNLGECRLKKGDIIKTKITSQNAKLTTAVSSGTDILSITKNANEQTLTIDKDWDSNGTIYLMATSNGAIVYSFEVIRPYTITLDATTNGGLEVDPVKGADGDKVILPHAFKKDTDPVKYYKFKGWYENHTGGDPVSNIYTVSGDKTLYAQFEDIPTSGPMFTLQMESSLRPTSNVDLKAASSTETVYLNLLQYATISGGAAVASTKGTSAGIQILTTPAIKMNGQRGCIKVDLDAPLQSGDEITAADVSANIWFTNSDTRPSSAPSTILGKTSPTKIVCDGSNLTGQTFYIYYSGSGATFTGLTITRPAPAATYTVTFDNNGKGGDAPAAQSGITLGGKATEPTEPEDASYNFGGWYNMKNWADPSAEKWNFGTSTVTKDTTLYAKWTDKSVPSTDATLSALSVAGCTFNETFDPATLAYTVDLPFYASMPVVGDVTATKNDENAKTPVVSVEGNVITVACEAEDGTTKINYTITVTIAATPTASTSVNLEQNVLDNGKTWGYAAALAAGNIVVDGVNSLDSLNDDPSKTARNYGFLGLKFNKAKDIIKVVVPASSVLNVKFGNIATPINVTVNGVAQTPIATKTNGTSTIYHLDEAAGVREVIFNLGVASKTVTLQQVKIGADVDAITLPWKVSFDVVGHANAVSPMIWKGTALTLPGVSNIESGYAFEKWNDGSNDYLEGAEYTPTNNVTLTAVYTMTVEDRMAELEFNGVAVAGFSPDIQVYNLTTPYAEALPQITKAVAVDAANGATATIQETYWDNDNNYYVAQAYVIPAGGTSSDAKFYQVRFTMDPKLGATIFRADLTAENAADFSGMYADEANSQIALSDDGANGYKFAGKSNFIKMAIADAAFAEGDMLKMTYTTNPQQAELAIYDGTTKLQGTPYTNHTMTFTDVVNGKSTLFIRRTNDNTFNGWVAQVEVQRYMAPIIKSYKIGAVSGIIDQEHKTIAIELPYGTSLYGVAATIEAYANGGATVIAPTPLAYDTPLGYKVSSAYAEDGDVDYTVTITEAEHYEAMIVGGANYETLAAAVAAAQADDVVKLLDNVDLMATGLTIAENITLDLNGFNIKAGEQLTNDINVPAGKKLTLVDNSANAEGKIYTEQAYTGAVTGYGVIRVSGEFLMQSGNIYTVIESDPANLGQFAVVLGAGGKATIEGGQIKAGWYAISNNGNNTGSTIIVSGGELISTADYAIYNPSKESTVTVSGGVVYGAAGGIAMNRGELTVTGGTITSKDQGTTGTWGDGTGGLSNAAISASGKYESVEVEISGGTIVAEGTAVMITNGTTNPVEVAISGGQFSHVVPAEYCAPGFAPVTEPNTQGKYEVEDKRIYIFDGSTMSNMATSPSGAISWAKVGDVMSATDKSGTYDEVNYTKALQLGNSSTTKHFKIDVALNNAAKIEVIGMSNTNSGDSKIRHAWLTNSTEKGEYANAIAGLESDGYNPAEFETEWLEEGSYYLHADNTVNIFLIRVTSKEVDPKCEVPTITTQPATDLTFGAGNMTATVEAEVSDEGTLTYQWYNAANDEAVVGQTTATLTTADEGTYYVIVTNTKASHRDNSIKSDEATLAHRVMNDATLSALGYGDPATAIALEADKYDYRVDLAMGTIDVPELTATATMAPYSVVSITNATEFVNYEATSTVLVTAEDGVTQKTYTVKFVVDHVYTALVDVTESTTWNWSGSAEAVINDVANKGLILANYIDGANFEMIEGKENERARRNQNGGVYQGTHLHFNTTVAGKVKFYFRAPSSGENCTITVKNNGKEMVAGTRGNSFGWSKEIVVKDDVVIEMVNDKSGGGDTRVQQIVFTELTPDYTRNVSNNIGTLCVDHNVLVGGAMGATFYQIASRNELYDYKIDFEEVLPNEELKAGEPYIFQSNTGKIELYYGETVADEPVAVHGMIGWFSNTEEFTMLNITEENKSDILYIAQNKLWNCEDLVTSDLKVVNNRAYIVMSDVQTYADYQAAQTSNPAPRRRVTLGKDEAQVVTGFGELETSETPVKVLINGQIFIIRGEKMFDVTGKLVK